MHRTKIRLFCLLSCLAGLLVTTPFGPSAARAETPAPAADSANNVWAGLVQDIFNNRPMQDGSGVIAIEMPYRAEDAAIVPVTLRTKLPADDPRHVVAITLVIDQDPGPDGRAFRLSAPTPRSPRSRPACGSTTTPTCMRSLN